MSQTRIREAIGPLLQGCPTLESLDTVGQCIGKPEDVGRTLASFADIGLEPLVFIPVVGWNPPTRNRSSRSV